MPRQRSILGEKAFGLIKTVTRLESTNPSVRVGRMDDYTAMHHNAQYTSFVCTQSCLGRGQF